MCERDNELATLPDPGVKGAETGRGASSSRDILIEEYQDFVESLVSKLIRAMNLPQKMREDFVAAGFLGLVEAASRFDAGRGSDFRSFAFLRVRGAVIDHIRASCDLTGNNYRMFKALEGAHDMRQQAVTERSRGTQNTRTRAASALDQVSKSAVAFKIMRGGDDHPFISSEQQADPESEFAKKEISQKIRRIIATLPEKERTIVEQYYFHDRKLNEVAAQYSGLSKSWVSRLHDRALELLRNKMVDGGLEEAI